MPPGGPPSTGSRQGIIRLIAVAAGLDGLCDPAAGHDDSRITRSAITSPWSYVTPAEGFEKPPGDLRTGESCRLVRRVHVGTVFEQQVSRKLQKYDIS